MKILKIDEMVQNTQLGVKQYMNANHPSIDDFNEDLQPFEYGGYWFYPVASRPAIKRFIRIDGQIDYSDWCNNFSKRIFYDYDRFYNTAKKYGYGNCDVFGCEVQGNIHYFIPTGSMLAEFPIAYGVKGDASAYMRFKNELENKVKRILGNVKNGVSENRIMKHTNRIDESIANNWLKYMIKKHGGIKNITKYGKSLMLDKLEDIDTKNFFFMNWREVSKLPSKIQDFFKEVFQCNNDEICCYAILPEYSNDDKVKEQIVKYAELQKNRDGEYTQKRGVKKQQPKRNGKDDYKPYFEKEVLKLVKKYNGVVYDGFYNKYFFIPVDDVWGEEAYNIEKEFRRYGYGAHENIRIKDYIDDLEKDGFKIDPNKQYLAISKGSSTFFEGDDTAMGTPYGWFQRHDFRPTIFDEK